MNGSLVLSFNNTITDKQLKSAPLNTQKEQLTFIPQDIENVRLTFRAHVLF